MAPPKIVASIAAGWLAGATETHAAGAEWQNPYNLAILCDGIESVQILATNPLRSLKFPKTNCSSVASCCD